MEAYGSHEELLASGVELMQLMRTKEEEDDRDLFSYDEEDEYEDYEEEEEDGEGGGEVRRESVGGRENGEMAPLVTPAISSNPHSPHMRKNIIYLDEGESTFSSLLKKPRVHYLGEDLNQFPPDSASIYSAPSMLSLHSAVEAESSKHEEEKVGGGGGGGGGG